MNLLPLWLDQILHPRVGMKRAHFEGEGNALASASFLESSRQACTLRLLNHPILIRYIYILKVEGEEGIR